eukprot:TRINITY_DN51_c1_g2_i1.p3 TRINITY_DN51_c1_g2~~TRINITY_DN51_c1_g2_i1.p3  ORF type:complete len:137 (+),score=34.10 TRINITY_DN51_c1_g2_i1:385-795(+)
MKPVRQTDFSPGTGNALQACVATILDLDLDAVPNFITAEGGYLAAINAFVATKGLAFWKLPIPQDGPLPWVTSAGSSVPCVVAGKSPRGDFKHCVVGTIVGHDPAGITFAHDPHPDSTMITSKEWVGVFVAAAGAR